MDVSLFLMNNAVVYRILSIPTIFYERRLRIVVSRFIILVLIENVTGMLSDDKP